jgi:hypothetical protein
MPLWRIRYEDRNGRLHAIYHTQEHLPSNKEALAVLHHELLREPGNMQSSRNGSILGLYGLKIVSVEPYQH